MRRGRTRKARPKAPLVDASDPLSMAALVGAYLESLRIRNRSEATIRNAEVHLRFFISWAAERSIARPADVTKPMIDRYQRALFYFRRDEGRPLSFTTQHAMLSHLKLFFRWLVRQNYLLHNPASEIELPKVEKRLPKFVLTANEADRVLALPDVTTPVGIRDRAMLEVFYSTGMRRSELIRLTIYDLDADRGTVMIRQGKGKKDRLVPIGDRAVAWLEKYLRDVRPQLVVEPDEGVIFLNYAGEPFAPDGLTQLVKSYVLAAGIGKTGSCHLFRHTMATLMLEGGADIRFVQEMLGHARLETTQIYTNVAIKKLKEIHSATHPAAKLERSIPLPIDDEDAE